MKTRNGSVGDGAQATTTSTTERLYSLYRRQKYKYEHYDLWCVPTEPHSRIAEKTEYLPF